MMEVDADAVAVAVAVAVCGEDQCGELGDGQGCCREEIRQRKETPPKLMASLVP